jgi:hypothetical protein
MGKQRQQQLERGWRKPRRSGTNGNCVELASGDRTVLVRDTEDRDGVTLSFSAESWAEFQALLR